jgi:hypothetical protein
MARYWNKIVACCHKTADIPNINGDHLAESELEPVIELQKIFDRVYDRAGFDHHQS